ncbi:MAG: DUF302 domain-containing protein [Pseudomonadota bacterium]
MRKLFLTTFFALTTFVAPLNTARADGHTKIENGWITAQSPSDVASTVKRLTAAIEKAGATLSAVVDHQAGAKKAGLEMAPATLVIFGNPKLGTPIMKSSPMAAHDLPIRVLVWSDNGTTKLAALAPETFKARHGVTADEALKKMGGALDNFMGAAIKP